MSDQKTQVETRVAAGVPGLSNPVEQVGPIGIGTAFAVLVGAILHLRRKASRDGTEIIKDRTEGKLVETLMLERDGARASEREAWSKHNDLSVRNARLETQNEYLKEEIDRLNKMVAHMQEQFDELKRRLQQLSSGATGHTGSMPLD